MTKIYGASDDLIEIDGEINEEANHIDPQNLLILCSDGTRARISYDDNGLWKIKIENKGHAFNRLVEANADESPHTDPDLKDCSGYSDVLVLNNCGLSYVKINKKYYRK